jgi:hypothetical protein
MGVVAAVSLGLVGLYVLLISVVALGLLRPRPTPAPPRDWPDVDVVVPARDEAASLPRTLASLRAQDYPGRFTLWIVDDRSRDATPAIAQAAAEADERVRLLTVRAPSRTWSPKVHAVWTGIRAGRAPWIVTTDADCAHDPGWLRALLQHATPGTTLVFGHVETARAGEARGLLRTFELVDWTVLMLVSRGLSAYGLKLASSANNQAYARAAFDAAGGFGVAGRAPSGDEDLLAQRIGRLPGARVAFADEPAARVLTEPQPSWGAFLRQRRRWVTRYQHLPQYQPGYLAGVTLFGAVCLVVTLAALAALLAPALAPAAVGLWGLKLGVEVAAIHVGLARLGRRDLLGLPVLAWCLLHPPVISVALVWSLLRPGSWRAGARDYRRRLLRARWRRWLHGGGRSVMRAMRPRGTPPTR